MRRLLCFLLLSLPGSALPVQAENECGQSSGTVLRVQARDAAPADLSLRWEGATDCQMNGERLAALVDSDFVKFDLPASELIDKKIQGRMTLASAREPAKSSDIYLQITTENMTFSPKIYLYFEKLPNREDSIRALDGYMNNKEIYRVFFAARDLAMNGANSNIKLTATYFYYQAAILIDASKEFSRGFLRVSDDARERMQAAIDILDDSRAEDHDSYVRALSNNRRYIRDIRQIKSELGMR